MVNEACYKNPSTKSCAKVVFDFKKSKFSGILNCSFALSLASGISHTGFFTAFCNQAKLILATDYHG
jgi:hypothetical protein